MALSPKDIEHIHRLVADGDALARRGNQHGQATDPAHRAECVGWLTAAAQVASVHVIDPQNAYRKNIDTRAIAAHGYTVHQTVGQVVALLKRLEADAAAGYLGSPGDQASADTFDNLLEHAQAYLNDGRKDPAAVLAGVVFEDVRRVACFGGSPPRRIEGRTWSP